MTQAEERDFLRITAYHTCSSHETLVNGAHLLESHDILMLTHPHAMLRVP